MYQNPGLLNLSFLFSTTNRDCYYLRGNNRRMLSLPKPNTNTIKMSFGYRGVMIWNVLPSKDKIQSLISKIK